MMRSLLILFILSANLARIEGTPLRQSNSTCSSCRSRDVCPMAYNMNRGGRCKCDADCEAYGDCCGMSPTQRSSVCSEQTPDPNLEGLKFTCRSVFLDSSVEVMESEAFWVVSTCPANWLEENNVIDSGHLAFNKCLSDNSSYPPVTDMLTGIVYKNEYCVMCNRVQNSVVVWQPSLGCSCDVYRMLGNDPTAETIKRILATDPNIFQHQCQPCSYRPPATALPPRACFPITCLDKTILESVTGFNFTTEAYKMLVNQCKCGLYDPQETVSSRSVYRSVACAKCVGETTANLMCYNSKSINTPRMTVPTQCIPISCPSNTVFSVVSVIPFTITLSSLGGGQVTVQVRTEKVNVTVDCPDGQAPVGLECRDTLCPNGFISTGGRCFFHFSDTNSGINSTSFSNGSGFFLDCPTELVALNNSSFILLTNSTISVDGKVLKVLAYGEEGSPLICPSNYTTTVQTHTFFTYPPGYIELVCVGCSLSAIGLSLIHI